MTKIYLPLEEGQHYACYVVYDKDTIRAYSTTPTYNNSSYFTDYFINSHYLSRDGYQTWGQYGNLPTCLDNSLITNDFYYRNDIADILISTFIIFIICVWMPLKLFTRIFGRWLKI